MNKETRPLNDTLTLKREIRTYGFAKPFWDGTRDKKVVIQYCKKTKKFQHFPRPTSIFTGRMGDIEWREISGKGEIFSYTVTYRGTDRFRANVIAIVNDTIQPHQARNVLFREFLVQ